MDVESDDRSDLQSEIRKLLAAALEVDEGHVAEMDRRDELHIAETDRRDVLHTDELQRRQDGFEQELGTIRSTNGVARAVRRPSTTCLMTLSGAAPLAAGGDDRIVDTNAAEIAKVAAFATKAHSTGANARISAHRPGPMTTPTSCTVCSSAFAGPIRASPTIRGSMAIAAGRSAVPAAEAQDVSIRRSRPRHGRPP